MNTATFVKRGGEPHFFGNWKKLGKRTRWAILGLWNQEDEAVYLEMSKDETDATVKPRQRMSQFGAGKEFADKKKAERKAARSNPEGREFATFGGEPRKGKRNKVEEFADTAAE